MLSAAAGGNVRDRSLEYFQKRLLHPFPRNVTSDGGVIIFPTDLVDLIDVDNTCLRFFEIAAGGLNKPQENILNILANVTRLGQARCINYAERNAQLPRKRLRKQCFACSCRADQQNIRFLKLNIAAALCKFETFVMLINGD